MSEKVEFLTELTKIIEIKLLQVQKDLNKKMEWEATSWKTGQ